MDPAEPSFSARWTNDQGLVLQGEAIKDSDLPKRGLAKYSQIFWSTASLSIRVLASAKDPLEMPMPAKESSGL